MNAHTRTNALTFDSPHSVTLSLQDWLGIQTRLGLSEHLSKVKGDVDTAEFTRGIIERLLPQTMPAIEAAAELAGESDDD